MQFAHTWQKVLSGEKTQTRRIQKPGELLMEHWPKNSSHPVKCITSMAGNVKWEVNRDYAVQPGRARKQIARHEILDLRSEDVREISGEDVLAEGFPHILRFWDTWLNMHDKKIYKDLCTFHSKRELSYEAATQLWRNVLADRPADRYQAWVIEFQLLPETVTA